MMFFLSKIILYIAFFVFTVIFSNNVFAFKKEIEEMSKKITASQNITYAYISKYSNSIVTSCVVKSDGSLSECKNTGNSFNNPSGIDFDYFNNLYVTNNNYTIVFCPASYNGQLPLCANAGGGEFSIPNGIVFNKGYALIANAVSSSVSVCKQNENGMLCSCVRSGSCLVNPTDIKIYKEPIYISEVSEIGTLNNCISSGTGFNNPIGIKIYKS